MGNTRYFNVVLASLFACAATLGASAQDTPCAFTNSSLSYAGSPGEEARCLLRRVKKGGRLGPVLGALPGPLDTLVGRKVQISADVLRTYLEAHGIRAAEIGGDVGEPLSSVGAGTAAIAARYFVIHDTSTPIRDVLGAFPDDINEAAWWGNDLRRVRHHRMAHLFINRVGESAPGSWSFVDPLRATKFEFQKNHSRLRGLFLHVELIQPRRSDLGRSKANDAVAPTPGFTEPQLSRLALVYIAASVRKGEWLIPAFHAVMDAGIVNGHDDPQHFDLKQWAECLDALLQTLRAQA